LNDERRLGSRQRSVWRSGGHTLLGHHLIVRYVNKGLELPHVSLRSGEEVLPVFSSAEAAQTFLRLHALGEGWRVRAFSAGELVSVLFAFRAGIRRVLLDPLPDSVLTEPDSASLVDRDRFVDSLVGN
jgi:hypothetical protein